MHAQTHSTAAKSSGGGGGGKEAGGERRRRRKPILKELSTYNDMEEGTLILYVCKFCVCLCVCVRACVCVCVCVLLYMNVTADHARYIVYMMKVCMFLTVLLPLSDEDDASQSTTSSLHVPGPCFSVYELRNKLFQTLSPNAVYIYTYKNQIKSFKLPIHWVCNVQYMLHTYMYMYMHVRT